MIDKLIGVLLFALAIAPGEAAPSDPQLAARVAEIRAAMRTDPERSRELAERALADGQRLNKVDLEVAAHGLLCDYYSERDGAAARRELDAARALLPHASSAEITPQLFECEGLLAELAGDSAAALTAYEQSVSAAAAAHDDELLANALFQRGSARGLRGDLALGLLDLRHANEIFERLKLEPQAAVALSGIATLYDRMGDYALARRYFEKTLAANERDGLLREQAVTRHNLGRTLLNLGEIEAAREAFEAALGHSMQVDFPRGEAYALRGLASVANAKGEAEVALALVGRADSLAAGLPDQRLRALLNLQRGIALRLLHKPAQSLATLAVALETLQGAESISEEAAVRAEIVASEAALGDYKAAYEQSMQLKVLNDRRFARQLEARFATLKVEFDTAATERENAVLKSQKQAADRALQQEQRASLLRNVALGLAVVQVVVLAFLVQRHRRNSRRMQGLAMTDELTQLASRRHVLGQLQALIGAGGRGALMIADLDLFKAINDRHGHLVGDEVLRASAAALRDAMPRQALLGRLGGEEFIAILPGMAYADAGLAAEQARRAVAALDASRWLPDRGITISLGLTGFGPGDDLGSVLRRADGALYEAKRCGRNCVRGAEGAGSNPVPARPSASMPLAVPAPDTLQ